MVHIQMWQTFDKQVRGCYHEQHMHAWSSISSQTFEIIHDFIPRIAIVITDGKSSDSDATARAAHLLRDDGVHVISVGVAGASYEELVVIAGDQAHVYSVANFADLNQLSGRISSETCNIVEDEEENRCK